MKERYLYRLVGPPIHGRTRCAFVQVTKRYKTYTLKFDVGGIDVHPEYSDYFSDWLQKHDFMESVADVIKGTLNGQKSDWWLSPRWGGMKRVKSREQAISIAEYVASYYALAVAAVNIKFGMESGSSRRL